MLDPILHQATRLRIMATLQRNRDLPFVELRDALGTTDGNLDAHGKVLAKAGYVRIRRALTPNGFVVRYGLTPEGAAAFTRYAAELRALLDAAAEAGTAGGEAPAATAAGPDDPARGDGTPARA